MLMLAIFIKLVVLHLLLVHGVQGQEIQIHIEEISTIRQPHGDADEHFGKGTKCVIAMNNGKFIPTTETCGEITKKIAELEEEE